MTEIGQRVRRVREALGLSQTAFANRMRYGRQHISNVEREVTTPGRRFLEQLAMLEREVAIKSTGDVKAVTQISTLDRGIDQSHERRVKEDTAALSPPPHHFDRTLIGADPGSSIRDLLPHEQYAAAVNMIGHLFEHHPDAFKAMMISLRGIYETHKNKPQ